MGDSKKRVAVVTGGSSGIGRALCRKLKRNGYRVYCFSRRNPELKGILHCPVDVTDEEAVNKKVETIIEYQGHIDLLVNCAGYGISGAAEFTDHDMAARQMDVNLMGTANVCKAVIPYMRRRKKGKIINISSVAAIMPVPFQVWYSTSKAAINAYSCSLANELRPYHIQVCAVMLGDSNTGFTSARQKITQGDDIYKGRIARSVAQMERDEGNGYSSAEVADYLMTLVEKKRLNPLYTMGVPYQLVWLLDHLLPSGMKNLLLYIVYGR